MSDDYKPMRGLNAITYLRNFIIESLILTDEEEENLRFIKKYYCKKNLKLNNFNIPPNIRAINKQLKKDGLKMCNTCGQIKPISEFFTRWGACRSCYAVIRKRGKE